MHARWACHGQGDEPSCKTSRLMQVVWLCHVTVVMWQRSCDVSPAGVQLILRVFSEGDSNGVTQAIHEQRANANGWLQSAVLTLSSLEGYVVTSRTVMHQFPCILTHATTDFSLPSSPSPAWKVASWCHWLWCISFHVHWHMQQQTSVCLLHPLQPARLHRNITYCDVSVSMYIDTCNNRLQSAVFTLSSLDGCISVSLTMMGPCIVSCTVMDQFLYMFTHAWHLQQHVSSKPSSY